MPMPFIRVTSSARSMPIRVFYPPIHQFIAPLHHFAANALRCIAVQIEVGAVRAEF